MSKRSESAERWRRILAAQRGSGMSVAAYCRRVRVPQSSFFAWRRRLQVADAHGRQGATFAEVRVNGTVEHRNRHGALLRGLLSCRACGRARTAIPSTAICTRQARERRGTPETYASAAAVLDWRR